MCGKGLELGVRKNWGASSDNGAVRGKVVISKDRHRRRVRAPYYSNATAAKQDAMHAGDKQKACAGLHEIVK